MSVSQTSPLFYLSQAGTSHAAAQLPAPPAFLHRAAVFLPAPPSSTTRAPPLIEHRPRPWIFAYAPSSALTPSSAAAGAPPSRRARPPSSASAPISTCSARAPPSSPAGAPPLPPREASPSRRARMPPELRLRAPLRLSSSHGASLLHARAAVHQREVTPSKWSGSVRSISRDGLVPDLGRIFAPWNRSILRLPNQTQSGMAPSHSAPQPNTS